MKNFLITISWYQPYPKESKHQVGATNLATATARALREWRKLVARKRIKEVSIKTIQL